VSCTINLRKDSAAENTYCHVRDDSIYLNVELGKTCSPFVEYCPYTGNVKGTYGNISRHCCPSSSLSSKSIYTKMDVCLCLFASVCVCIFGHNSGTPGAISTKLGTYMAVCMCKNLMYILSTYFIS
jgi:hypothetical protein